ncbi:L-histidine N(alpha)-methyltransferase [Pseudomonas kuykendallii]|uniref:Dimethylhistidine N-methyltransferase n=1 Tax=Pseudomonas kuykendallii TaxID=1007099 RepID=A0A1H3BU11_9PSED|nr:L-histidine N(alpha)-methyltransferase [Pseudomonas kuykendallii]MCQ4269794.1 L-histidine N(alpha)-methyltransferase [Pseudomonas kuykendallii]SDX45373.1 dimethylhistidine N-methyltransferase [Pseudomonas kuykendallii]
MALAVRFHDQRQCEAGASLRDEALAGFAAKTKQISPKFFYDRRGSELFEQICKQPEYYPTRTEELILSRAANDIAEIAGQDANLVELGSGASRKVRLLLEAMHPASYLGIDISEDFLLSSTRRLAADYPWLEVHASCADFSLPMTLPDGFDGAHPLAFFPGSSIGNFSPEQALAVLRNLHELLPAQGGLLVGVDLVKDKDLLEAAYNDEAGVTAAFNLNLLQRIRQELDSDIDPDRFIHHAFFNEAESRIEMHLISPQAQDVTIEGRRFHFERGESLHTENSYKYTPASFRDLAGSAGFKAVAMWTDPRELFSVHYLQRD